MKQRLRNRLPQNLLVCLFAIFASQNLLAQIQFSGTIRRQVGLLLPDIQVNVTGDVNASETTNVNGDYSFTQGFPIGSNLLIRPKKDTLPSEHISVLDLAMMQRHVINLAPLPHPYMIIAADVNRSQSVTTFDISQTRDLLLDKIQKFPNSESWRFVDQNFVFPDPFNPFLSIYPEEVQVLNLLGPFSQNFIGMKVGDVSDGSVPNQAGFMTATLPTLTADVGQSIAVPITVKAAVGIVGFQFSLKWDPAILSFKNLTNLNLPGLDANQNFNTAAASAGHLTFCWHSSDALPLSLPDGTAIFQVVFQVVGSGHSGLDLVEFPTRTEVVNSNFLNFDLLKSNGAVDVAGTLKIFTAGTGDWDNPQNWTPAGVPSTIDMDSIPPNSVVTLPKTTELLVRELRLGAKAKLSGLTDTLRIWETGTFNCGEITVPLVIDTNAVLHLDAPDTLYKSHIFRKILWNRGTVNFVDGEIILDSTQIRNEKLFVVKDKIGQAARDIVCTQDKHSEFINTATGHFLHENENVGGGSLTIIAVEFINDGKMTLQEDKAGIRIIRKFTNNKDIIFSNNYPFELNGGWDPGMICKFALGGSVTGTGAKAAILTMKNDVVMDFDYDFHILENFTAVFRYAKLTGTGTLFFDNYPDLFTGDVIEGSSILLPMNIRRTLQMYDDTLFSDIHTEGNLKLGRSILMNNSTISNSGFLEVELFFPVNHIYNSSGTNRIINNQDFCIKRACTIEVPIENNHIFWGDANATLTLPFQNTGQIKPGCANQIGNFDFTGNEILTSTSLVGIEFNGANHDKITNHFGSLQLGGVLEVKVLNNNMPPPGSYVIITSDDANRPADPNSTPATSVVGSLSGAFSSVDLPAGFFLTQTLSSIILTVGAMPNLTCPPDLTVSTDPSRCTASNVPIGNPTAFSNAGCNGLAITSNAPSIFPIGPNTVVFVATDDCGTSTCSMTVTVEDNEAPVLTCPTDLTLLPSVPNCNAVANFLPPTVFENCPPLGASLTSNIQPGSLLGVGQHTVTYSYSNSFGETANCSFEINVLSGDDSTFVNRQICAGETVTVGGQIFSQTGNFNVLLKNLIGCDSIVFLNLTVNPLPIFSISGPATICPTDPDSLRIFGNFSKIDWSGPSGFTASGGQILVSEPGVYIATVTDASGCSAIATKILTLFCGSVLANFTSSADTICTDFGVNFLDKSIGTMTQWLWDFGNGTFSSLQNPPTIFYPVPGVYTVSLTVLDNTLTNTFSKKILIYAKPQVNFQTTVPDLCDPLTLKMDGTAAATFPVQTWAWNFGDGTSGATQSLLHTFPDFDTVQTSLRIVDRFGCTDSLDFDVRIVPNGIAPLPKLLSPVLCPGEKLTVGTTVFDENNLSGKVILNSFHGCDSVVEVKLSYLPGGSIFLGNDTTVCENQQVTLNAGTGGTFKWNTGATSQIITVGTAGVYSVTISGSSGNCAASGLIEIFQDKIPNLQADAGSNQTICQTMQFVRLDAKKPTVGTGAWASVGSAAVDNPSNPQSFIFDLKTGKNLFVWTLSNGACRNYDSDTTTVEVFPLVGEQPFAGADVAFCETSVFKLNASPPVAAGLTGFWTQAAGQNLIITNANDPKSAVSGLNDDDIYLLFWNLTNGVCPPRTDDVLISRSTKVLPTSNAGDNQVLCEETKTSLKGNLPPGTTGKWSAVGNAGTAVIGNENSPTTPVLNIAPGTLRMVWTLSSEGCGGFSADTMVIFQSGGLEALDDGFKDKEHPLTGLNVLGNDSIGLKDNIILPLPFTQPDIGNLVSKADGTFDFSFGADTARTTFFTYKICLKSCPDICSEAEVEIFSDGPPPELKRPPNVMTPNGDGVADFFEIPNFKELRGPIYLTVVNRWGDVVYLVDQPDTYKNDWAGTDQFDNPLPVGTYFFIFRGGGGDGEETGFITILR